MDTMTAYAIGRANRGKEEMVFDWEKAARVLKELGAKDASAGLEGDWEWTGGEILRDGRPIPEDDTYIFLASTWAKPQLLIAGESIPCFRMESETPGWHSKTYWLPEAMAILDAANPT